MKFQQGNSVPDRLGEIFFFKFFVSGFLFSLDKRVSGDYKTTYKCTLFEKLSVGS